MCDLFPFTKTANNTLATRYAAKRSEVLPSNTSLYLNYFPHFMKFKNSMNSKYQPRLHKDGVSKIEAPCRHQIRTARQLVFVSAFRIDMGFRRGCIDILWNQTDLGALLPCIEQKAVCKKSIHGE
jgi:hypothetical protein